MKDSNQLSGECDDCGRAINETAEICAGCLSGDRDDQTLSDFA